MDFLFSMFLGYPDSLLFSVSSIDKHSPPYVMMKLYEEPTIVRKRTM